MFDSFGCGQLDPFCNDVFDPCSVTKEQFVCQALKLLPDDALYARPGCTFHNFFCAIACCFYDEFRKTCDLRPEANPCTSDSTIEEWASIWSDRCTALPTDPDELRDALCALMQSNGVLTCDIITEQLEAAGYVVNSCSVDKTRTTEPVQRFCGMVPGVYVPGYCGGFQNLSSCADKFKDLPCADQYIAACCEGEETPEIVTEINCDVQSRPVRFYKMGSPGYQALGDPYFPLVNPWTVNAVIDISSPALDAVRCDILRSQWPAYPGFSPGPKCFEINIEEFCVIEALRPAHLCLNIKLECPF